MAMAGGSAEWWGLDKNEKKKSGGCMCICKYGLTCCFFFYLLIKGDPVFQQKLLPMTAEHSWVATVFQHLH